MDPILAGDPRYTERIQTEARKLAGGLLYHSIELPNGEVLPGLQSIAHLKGRMAAFGLPDDLRGKRALDIGAWDGWFSFELERRGAHVVAVDCMPFRTFLEARRLMGSRVEYRIMDMNELTVGALGRFDIVLFLGVLYHLRDPLIALERIVSLTTDLALIDSFVIPSEYSAGAPRRILEFYETTELGGQLDNWFGPTAECLNAMCRAAGFAQVRSAGEAGQRASLICSRHWPAPPDHPEVRPPILRVVTNNRDFRSEFHPSKDEYLACFFHTDEQALAHDDVMIEVDGYGTPALSVSAGENGEWQANCVRPPDLGPGEHLVRLRTRRSAFSNAAAIYVPGGAPLLRSTAAVPRPMLRGVTYRAPADLRYLDRGELQCWFETPAACVARDITVAIDGEDVPLRSLVYWESYWQANIAVPPRLPSGAHEIRLRIAAGPFSNPQTITLDLPPESPLGFD